jgi:YD repeat-containing protein
VYNGLGQVTEKRQYETSSSYIAAQTQYDALGRAFKVSNPYRTGETLAWAISEFDGLGRLTKVTTPDNAIVHTYYDGARTLVQDQIGKERLSITNGLGQLKEVWEITAADLATETISFPQHSEVTAGYRTKYDYDTLDNLVTVRQQVGTSGTMQTRTFAYDSLKRLLSATNPESGTVDYKYDPNGNLIVKSDARTDGSSHRASAHFSYDALNRLTRRWYNGSTSESDTQNNNPALPTGVALTAEANYFYDAATLPALSPAYRRSHVAPPSEG